MGIALAVILCLGAGFALVSIGWCRGLPSSSDLVLRGSLAVGFRLGIFSCVFFFLRLLGIGHFIAVDGAVLGVLLIVYFISRQCGSVRPLGPQRGPLAEAGGTATAVPFSSVPSPSMVKDVDGTSESVRFSNTSGYDTNWRRFQRLLTVAFLMALCVALYAAIMHALAYPEGDGWDSFAIWNLRARFLFCGGNEHWRDGFTQLLPWSHPDYPLLLPASIAHFWIFLGRDAAAVPAVIGFAFTFSTVGMLYAALAILRGRTRAKLAALMLLATPAFITLGTSQYVDVPLGFFLLGAVVLLALQRERGSGLRGLAILAGISAGFAAWTKNEGLLFAEALILVSVLDVVRRKYTTASRRELAWLLAGSLPLLLLVLSYKHWITGPGDLFSSPAVMLERLEQLTRYGIVAKWFAKDLLRFGGWFLVPGSVLLVALYFLKRRNTVGVQKFAHSRSIVALLITLAGYFAIYLITPRDLYWHLRFSLDRLFLQLWPSAIFFTFLTMTEPEMQDFAKVSK